MWSPTATFCISASRIERPCRTRSISKTFRLAKWSSMAELTFRLTRSSHSPASSIPSLSIPTRRPRVAATGGLIASGWHTSALLLRMNCEAFLTRAAILEEAGVEEVRWQLPVRPGDRLHVRRQTLACRSREGRCGAGEVEFLYEVINQDGAAAMMSAQRAPAQAASTHSRTSRVSCSTRTSASASRPTLAKPSSLGRRFSPTGKSSIRASSLRPPTAMRGSRAAGMHVAAAGMRRLVETRSALRATMAERGETLPQLGVSPGFKDMRWAAPGARGRHRFLFGGDGVETRDLQADDGVSSPTHFAASTNGARRFLSFPALS